MAKDSGGGHPATLSNGRLERAGGKMVWLFYFRTRKLPRHQEGQRRERRSLFDTGGGRLKSLSSPRSQTHVEEQQRQCSRLVRPGDPHEVNGGHRVCAPPEAFSSPPPPALLCFFLPCPGGIGTYGAAPGARLQLKCIHRHRLGSSPPSPPIPTVVAHSLQCHPSPPSPLPTPAATT